MATKSPTEKDNDVGIMHQFNDLKKKHPDAILLFRKGDFYETFNQDAVKAAAVLAITITNRILPTEKEPIKVAIFPYHALDAYLPKLIRAGMRVAICDALEAPKKIKKESTLSNNETMVKKKKEQGTQEAPTQAVKNAAEEKPARKAKTKVDAEVKSEQQAETKQERKPREPQMVTANGEKVTHGHA